MWVSYAEKTGLDRRFTRDLPYIQAGETIYIVAKPESDGKLTAVRVQVSKDGIKPTQ